jgi:hypothetical protein
MALFNAAELIPTASLKTDLAPDLKNSHSEIESFNACERLHWYRYGLKVEAVTPSVHLVRGSIGHAGLAAYYSGIAAGDSHNAAAKRGLDVTSEQLDRVESLYPGGKLREDIGRTLIAYFKWVEPEASSIQVLGVEQEFSVRINDSFTLPFIVDLILRTESGVEAWDHKFVSNFFNPNVLDLTPQLPLYYAGLRMSGYEHFTVRYNELRYRVTKANTADPEQRFNRPAPRITPSRILTTMEEHIRVGRRIYRYKQLGVGDWEKEVIRKKNRDCAGCDFAQICTGELNGESRDLYLGVDYVPKKRRMSIEPK